MSKDQVKTMPAHPASIKKRDGSTVPFDTEKIKGAMRKAAQATEGETLSEQELDRLTGLVVSALPIYSLPSVEQIQDRVEETLMQAGYVKTARVYIVYRAEHSKIRQSEADLMNIYKELTFAYAKDADIKRENANIDADSSMGVMLKYGSEGAKYFVDNYILPKDIAGAHINGDIHIHDKDFYMLTETCCQIDLISLLRGGFSTGHGYLREPGSIASYSALACIVIQANQNEMHGGQSIPNFDYAMAPGVRKTFVKEYRRALEAFLCAVTELNRDQCEEIAKAVCEGLRGQITLSDKDKLKKALSTALAERPKLEMNTLLREKAASATFETARAATEKATYQAMEAFIHNLNTMNSRAGAQVPFSSVNYGTDISPEGRMVARNQLRATDAGLGNGETPIFPVQIFKVKLGLNYNPCDPSYDLFRLAMEVSARRLFPNFSFLDAPFNLQYYKEGDYNSEVSYMGCRTRVIANVHDRAREVTCGRGNLSFTSINLPRIGLQSRGDMETFYQLLDQRMEMVFRQLLHRFGIQSGKRCRNYPFLMGQGVWLDSEKLGPDDKVGEVLKHGTLSVGFIGLAEPLVSLIGEHHGQSDWAQGLGLEIVSYMRKKCDEKSAETGLNFTLLATPAEGLSGRFVRMDKKLFGTLPCITDRDYYTNSFHIPVYFPIGAFEKIEREAPYHALTNAGHISYVEMDGDVSKNLPAFEAVIRCMKENGVGYGSINHPVDRDPVCGYTGVINEICPRCGRREGEPVDIEKLKALRKKIPGMPNILD